MEEGSYDGSTTNVRVPNVRVEKHQSGQTQESQTSEWDKRQSGQTQDFWDKRQSGHFISKTYESRFYNHYHIKKNIYIFTFFHIYLTTVLERKFYTLSNISHIYYKV